MKWNRNSQAEDGRTAGLVFRSFLDGVIILILAALLLTVRIVPAEHEAAKRPESGDQPVRASLLPSIHAVTDPVAADVESPGKKSECLVIRLRQCSDEAVEIIPKALRPEI
jgi:hypothetical protein